MDKNEFKNVITNSKPSRSHTFTRNILTPFISGVLGGALVLRYLFYCSYYKAKINWRNRNIFFNY